MTVFEFECRFVDAETRLVKDLLTEMEQFSPVGSNILNRTGLIETEPAMMYDSVHVFARGLDAATAEGPELKIRNLSCDDELPWKEGSTLYNYLSGVSFKGLTGPIK